MKSFVSPAETIPRVKGGHVGDWLRACKDGKPASSNFADYGGQLTEMLLHAEDGVQLRVENGHVRVALIG